MPQKGLGGSTSMCLFSLKEPQTIDSIYIKPHSDTWK